MSFEVFGVSAIGYAHSLPSTLFLMSDALHRGYDQLMYMRTL
jgi:hypothetical protein